MSAKLFTLLAIGSVFFHVESNAQEAVLLQKDSFVLYNRILSVEKTGNDTIVHLDAKPKSGVAWLKDMSFENGVIEFDVKGKNVQQQSFVGIAFHGINDSTYDAIYFRPFNFQSKDSVRKGHSVQYINMPKYEWFVLREDFPGKYENALTKSIDPNQWFHAKIVVDKKEINVFVDNDDKPSLTVKALNNYGKGKIGFWVGDNADGDFKNLVIRRL